MVLKKQSYLKVEHKVADQIGLENHGSTPSLMSINKKKVFLLMPDRERSAGRALEMWEIISVQEASILSF